MKSIFLFLLIATSFICQAQVTATIDNIETVTQGKNKGDIVTFTVSAPHNELWGITLQYNYDGQIGHNGIWCPSCGSFTTTTYSIFVQYSGKLPSVRTYTVQVMFRPNPDYPTPQDSDAVVYSAPVTVTK